MRIGDLLLVVVTAVFAPPIAALAFLGLTAVLRHGPQGVAALGAAVQYALTPYTWIIALVPALLAGAANAVAGRLVRTQVLRLLVAIPAGTVPFLGLVGWLAQDQETGAFVLADLVALGMAGGLASLVCVALVESFAPGGAA